jgi:hypothetical protein
MFGVDFTQDTIATLKAEGLKILHEENITGDILKFIIAEI